MKKISITLIALAGLLALSGTTHAGGPAATMLLLPQLFGQEASRDLPPPAATTPSPALQPLPARAPAADAYEDAEWIGSVFSDAVNRILDQACCQQVRWLALKLQPYAPYNLAADAVLGYFSVMEARVASANTNGAVDGGTRGIGGGVFTRNPSVGWAVGADNTVVRTSGATWPSNHVQTCPATPSLNVLSRTADACDASDCCRPVAKLAASLKACNCCEDAKACTCGTKTGAVQVRVLTDRLAQCPQTPLVIQHDVTPVMPWMLGASPQGMPMPRPVAMPTCTAELLYHPQMVQCSPQPVAQHPMHDMPLYPIEELKELIRQRQMITRAIEQIEKELMRMTLEKQRAQAQAQVVAVTHNAQKVHLATEFFDAHCDSLRCVNGDAQHLVLEGDVRLTCKKGKHPIRIDAARVIISLADGTFKVESMKLTTPFQAGTVGVERAVFTPPSDWMPNTAWPAPLHIKQVPQYVAPTLPMPSTAVPQSWQVAPYRVAPPPAPVVPRQGGLPPGIEFKY